MIPDRRAGLVALKLGEREVGLRFTWGAIDRLGRGGVAERLQAVQAGAPGDVAALAELVAAGSDGALSADEVIAASPPFEPTLVAVVEAWLLALHGPHAAEPAEEREPANPRVPRRTWWRRA